MKTCLLKQIKPTNENNIAAVQVLITFPSFQKVQIDHCLRISGPLCNTISVCVLHLYVIDCIISVFHIDIETHTSSVRKNFNRLLTVDRYQVS